MKKSELKTGDLVTVVGYNTPSFDGLHTVMLDTAQGSLLIDGKGGFDHLDAYNEDMIADSQTNIRVIKVERPINYGLNKFEIIWERKKQLAYNAWYTHSCGSVVYFTGETSGWGVSSVKRWFNHEGWIGLNSGGWRPATHAEVKNMLIAEAEKRGFTEGVRFRSAVRGDEFTFWGEFDFDLKHNNLFGSGRGCVFGRTTGAWAEIIEEKLPEYTWEQIKEKLGHEFTIKEK